jgi:hypothetical protein
VGNCRPSLRCSADLVSAIFPLAWVAVMFAHNIERIVRDADACRVQEHLL